MDPNKAESAREEAEEKIRGKRKACMGPAGGGRPSCKHKGLERQRGGTSTKSCHSMESWVGVSGRASGMERKHQSEHRGEN